MVRAAPVGLLVAVVVLQLSCPADTYYFKSHHQRHHPQPHHHPQPQRFQRLERLLTRLESAETSTPAPPPPPPPVRSAAPAQHWNDQDSYEESDEEDEDLDNEEDEDDDFEDEDDEDEDDDSLQQPQSDDQSSAWDVPQSEARYQPPMSPISQSKWETMGSRKAVDDLRRSRLGASSGYKLQQHSPEFQQAVEHMVRVTSEGECKIPKPKLVQVKNEYPHPSKIYLPRCTILHQCGDDTGCCKAESLTCVPRYTNRVDLYFYTSTVGVSGPQRVERLTFYNHTECMCEDRNTGIMPRDVETGHYFRRSATYGSGSHFRKTETERPETKSCRCPSKYSVRHGRDGSCSCDCFDKQRECLRLKKGKDYFTTHDRLCIQSEECKLPSCEFGSYLRLAGRCPKKRERYEGWNQ